MFGTKHPVTAARRIHTVFEAICMLLALMVISPVASANQVVGSVTLLKGVVTAQAANDALRTLAKGSDVYLSDQLETSRDSFVVIGMNDGGKITLRPETVLQVISYSEEAGREEEKMKLVKGGLRAISGAIGRARPEAVQLETRTTTIGIRGTDFLAYDCLSCDQEEKRLSDKARIPPGLKDSEGNPLPVLTVIDADTRRILEREEVGEIKRAVYFAALDKKIYAVSGDQRIDLEAIDACYRAGKTPFDPDQEFHCLIEVPNFMLLDSYLMRENDEFTLYNIFRELNDENELCEIE